MQKVILDTDLGDDIDDALALSFLLNLKDIELLGVTTVFGNSDVRARIAKKILHLSNRSDIPVYKGYSSICNGERKNWNICQYTDDLNEPQYDPDNAADPDDGETAIDFIIENAAKYKKELVLVAIGPFTNLAKAIEKAPEVMKEVGKIVVMGGTFFDMFREWNVFCDPEAAKILFEFPVPLYCVGTDVTYKCTVSEEQMNYMMSFNDDSTIQGYLGHLMRLWKLGQHRLPILHDPLAVFTVVNDTHVTFKEIMAKVETKGEFTRGCTVNYDRFYHYLAEPLPGRRIFAGYEVDSESFIRLFLTTVFGEENAKDSRIA